MAEEAKPATDTATTDDLEPGAPFPKGKIDEELIKLPRKTTTRIGLVTAAGIVFLSVFFIVKLNPDRRFAMSGESPAAVTVPNIVAGKIDTESLVSVEAEPLMAHAVRTGVDKTSVGLRVVPVKGSGEKLWIVLDGDGWANPAKGPYVGRLRAFRDLKFVDVVTDFVAKNPRPLFASAAAVRTGFSSSRVMTVSGEEVTLRDGDRVGFDVVDPNAALIVCAYNERLPNLLAWRKALDDAGITTTGTPKETRDQVRFDVAIPGAVATVATKLEAAALWAARVDSVTRHYETTWGALKGSGPAGFTAPGATIPDAQLDLVGIYVVRGVPSGAYALVLGEDPQGYWYVLPVTIVMALLGLLFLWALVRAVKRDLLQA